MLRRIALLSVAFMALDSAAAPTLKELNSDEGSYITSWGQLHGDLTSCRDVAGASKLFDKVSNYIGDSFDFEDSQKLMKHFLKWSELAHQASHSGISEAFCASVKKTLPMSERNIAWRKKARKAASN